MKILVKTASDSFYRKGAQIGRRKSGKDINSRRLVVAFMSSDHACPYNLGEMKNIQELNGVPRCRCTTRPGRITRNVFHSGPLTLERNIAITYVSQVFASVWLNRSSVISKK